MRPLKRVRIRSAGNVISDAHHVVATRSVWGYPWPMSPLSGASLLSTARNMAIDRVTCEVVTAFRREDIATILLKGPAIAQWLYASGGRSYGDSDLLVSPADFSRSAGVLRKLGFGEPMRGRAAHAHTYRRRDPNADCEFCVDLHRSLPSVTAPARDVWRVLSSGTEQIRIGGIDIPVLGLPQRSLHVAIHAVQHAFESAKPLEDLRRAIAVVDSEIWSEAATQSRALGAEDALAAGLCLLPEGQVIADRLCLTRRRRGILRIASSSAAEGSAFEVQRVLDASSFGERIKLISDGVLLSPASLRLKSPMARRGRTGLVLAYICRPFHLVKRLGPALATRTRILKSP